MNRPTRRGGMAGFVGAGFRPTAYLRLFKEGPDFGPAHLRQWWMDETGQGEWRPIDLMIGREPGWDGDPRTTPANTQVIGPPPEPIDEEKKEGL